MRLLGIALLCVLIGCGSGGGSTDNNPGPNSFGNYSGTWRNGPLDQQLNINPINLQGPANFTIDSTGVHGTLTDTASGKTFTFATTTQQATITNAGTNQSLTITPAQHPSGAINTSVVGVTGQPLQANVNFRLELGSPDIGLQGDHLRITGQKQP